MNRVHLTVVAAFVFSAGTASITRAADHYASPGDDLRDKIAAMSEGDTLYLAEGTYSISAAIWFGPGYSPVPSGEAGRIYLKANPGAASRPHVDCTTSAQNVFNLYGAKYLTIEGIEISGGSNGIKIIESSGITPCYITIKDCYIHNTAGPAVDLKTGTHHVTVTECEVAYPGGTGECFYIGSSSSEDLHQVHHCVISKNLIHDTLSASNGDGIELKWKTYANEVRDNVIYNVKYPGIFVYGHPGHTSEADLTVVEGNVVFDASENGIQVYNTAVIRNNILCNVSGRGIEVRPYSASYPVTNVRLVNNTLYDCNDAVDDGSIRLNDLDTATGVVIANNAVYATRPYALVMKPMYHLPSTNTRFYANLWYSSASSTPIFVDQTGTDSYNATDFRTWLSTNGYSYPDNGNSGANPQFTNPGGRNFYPQDTSPLIDMGTTSYAPSVDFDGTARDGSPDTGAYEWVSGGSPGWIPGKTFKGTDSGPGNGGGDGVGGGCGSIVCRPEDGLNTFLPVLLVFAAGWWLLRKRSARAA